MDSESLRNELLTSQWSGFSPGNISYTGGNVGIGTNNPVSTLYVSGTVGTITNLGQGVTSSFSLNDSGTKTLWFVLNSGSGAYNGLSQTGDSLFLSGAATSINTGTLSIVPWNNGYVGVRIGSTSNIVTVASNLTSFLSNTGSTAMTIQNGYINYGLTYKYNIFWATSTWSYSTTGSGSFTSLWSFSYTLPQASYVDVSIHGHWQCSTVGGLSYIMVSVDGLNPLSNSTIYDSYTAGVTPGQNGAFHDYYTYGWQGYAHTLHIKLPAGSHSFGLGVLPYNGYTYYYNGGGITLTVIPVSYL
jgi:hypothetical protein